MLQPEDDIVPKEFIGCKIDWKEGKDVTDPMLDIDDFIGKSFTTAPNGHLYQLPDQQFANL